MTAITLIRHGIAEEKTGEKSDFLRALTPEGRMDFLSRLHRHSDKLQDIDMIICSPAVRCSQTCALLCSVIDIDPDRILYDNRIYSFEEGDDVLVHILKEIPKDKQHICIIGHNPSMMFLANRLTSGPVHMKKGKIVHTEWKS